MRQPRTITRRAFVGGVTVGSMTIFASSLHAAEYNFKQYHNQPESSPHHQRLSQMWAAVRAETRGRVETQVFPENNKIAGSDPGALKMLVSGEIQFFTLMGGILANVAPAAGVQQVPFAFRSAAHAHSAMDGALGAYIRQEMKSKGIFGFPVGAFDNGMRQIGGTKRPISTTADMAGLRMRVPAGKMFEDMFRALGAETVTVNSSGIYKALQSGLVDAQENPLAYMELFKHYEVMKYISMTNHMWSGFNLMAHLPTWNGIPDDIKSVIERNAAKYARLQRQDQQKINDESRTTLAKHGLIFNEVDATPFRAKLSGFYSEWKKELGTKCWSLLEAETGRLG